jgi:hypothetical protein
MLRRYWDSGRCQSSKISNRTQLRLHPRFQNESLANELGYYNAYIMEEMSLSNMKNNSLIAHVQEEMLSRNSDFVCEISDLFRFQFIFSLFAMNFLC